MKVGTVETEDALDRVCPVMAELRTSFDLADLRGQIEEQMKSGYRLAFVEEEEEILCVAGFVVCLKLAWGKHIYVDDLVTAAEHRSRGAGSVMIDWLIQHARDLGCRELHLDSGVQRFGAHRFYLREGFRISSHHFEIEDLEAVRR